VSELLRKAGDFIKRWILPLIWLTIITFGTYFLFMR